MAEVLTLDGIKTYVKDAFTKDNSKLEDYRLQLTDRLTRELGHSPVRLAEINQVVARIDFELAARAIEDVVSDGAISLSQLGQGIKASLEVAPERTLAPESLESVS